MSCGELAYEAMRLIHQKRLQFVLASSDGATQYRAVFRPKDADGSEIPGTELIVAVAATAQEAMEGVVEQVKDDASSGKSSIDSGVIRKGIELEEVVGAEQTVTKTVVEEDEILPAPLRS
jgi:hypothetical protein